MEKSKCIKVLSMLFCCLFIMSCESFYWATIINDSSKTITINIKHKINKAENREFVTKAPKYLDDSMEIVELKPTEEYTFPGNIRKKPDFSEIEYIEIFSNNKSILKSFDVDKLFNTNEEKGIYELRIE